MQNSSYVVTYTLPVFTIDDKRKQYNACNICSKSFNLLNQEHQCKRCKRAVCSSCSQSKAIIVGYLEEKSAHRVCNICKQEIDFIQSLITTKKVQFSVDCFLSKQWLGYIIPQQKGYEELIKDYENSNIFQQNQKDNDYSELNLFQSVKDQGFKTLMTSFHYSLKEFVYYSTKNKKESDIFIFITNVMSAILVKLPKMGYTPEFLQLILFVGCFCSEVITFHIVLQILTKILPQEIYPKILKMNGYNAKAQNAVMVDIIEQSTYKLSQAENQAIIQFLEEKFLNYAYNFGVCFFNFETSYFIFDLIVRKGQFTNFEVALIIALCKNKDIMIQSKSNIAQIELGIMRKLHAKTLMQEISQLQQQGFQMKGRRKSTIANFQEEQKKQIIESEVYQKLQKDYTDAADFLQNSKQQNSFQTEKIQNLEQGIIEREQQIETLQKQVKTLEDDNFKLGVSVSLSKTQYLENEIQSLKKKLDQKDQQCQEYINKFMEEQQKFQQFQLEAQMNQVQQSSGGGSNENDKGISKIKEQILSLQHENGKLKVENQQLTIKRDIEVQQQQVWKQEQEIKEDKLQKNLEKISLMVSVKEKEIFRLEQNIKDYQAKQQDFENHKQIFSEEAQRIIVDFQTFKKSHDILQTENYHTLQIDWLAQYEYLKDSLMQPEQKIQLDDILSQFQQVCYDLQFYIRDNSFKNEMIAQLNDEIDEFEIKMQEQEESLKVTNSKLQQTINENEDLSSKIQNNQKSAGKYKK